MKYFKKTCYFGAKLKSKREKAYFSNFISLANVWFGGPYKDTYL